MLIISGCSEKEKISCGKENLEWAYCVKEADDIQSAVPPIVWGEYYIQANMQVEGDFKTYIERYCELKKMDIKVYDFESGKCIAKWNGKEKLSPDLEEYQSGRGLYVPVSRLPGYVSSNINDISITLGNICTSELVNPIREKYLERYSKLHEDMSQWCIYNDDGNSCKRLVDVVFRREPVSELEGDGVYSVINGLEAHKEKILICVNTNYNDMTFYENLRKKLESYEYRTTDVTILTTSFTDTKYKVYFNNNIPKEVRVLVWYALPYVTKYNQKFFKREIKRSLGNVRFDEVLMEGTLTEYWAEFGNAIKKL